eukprot:7384314-Alexandrium_andersonii.AAC.1
MPDADAGPWLRVKPRPGAVRGRGGDSLHLRDDRGERVHLFERRPQQGPRPRARQHVLEHDPPRSSL